jgi:carotenoid cleavage dioxygenase-like enzyme
MTENTYLSGNFGPVQDETTAFDLPHRGTIPDELNGRLLRIGPNPLDPDPARQHWFTGTGLVHGLRLRGGKAEWYRSRFVGDDEVVRVHGAEELSGPANQMGTNGSVNTNVIGLGGKTFAIVEAGGRAIELSAELESIRRSDFNGTLDNGFTAHPKVDPDTGEAHAALYSPLSEDVQYVVVAGDGRVRKKVDIHMPHKPMIHDCAITENYFLILDFPVVFDPEMLVDGWQLPYRWHPELPARVGLLPREGDASDIVWCEVEPCFAYHPMNAYEDSSGRVVLDIAKHPKMFDTDLRGPNEGPPILERWTLDPQGGATKVAVLHDKAQEFPRIDERLIGKPYRYGYTVALTEGFLSRGIYKHDLVEGRTEVHEEGDHRSFLEPVFVSSGKDADEDEGWILAFVHDQERNQADVVILNPQDFAAAPIATIPLPARVPFGFHGNWLPED